MNKRIGHEQQIYELTEMRLVGGRGDGMRMLLVKNVTGLEFMVSLDRAGDIVKLSLKGDNFGYFAPCGYVAPTYYDCVELGFLKSFTAGFFTTCGLKVTGRQYDEDGNALPLHGSISNTPCEKVQYYVENDEIHIKVTVRDAALFGDKLLLEREYVCPLYENVIYLNDKIINIGSKKTPIQVLYHCNMGYPLLSENAELKIPGSKITPRTDHAATGIDKALIVEEPQADYDEMCFYHELSGKPTVSIYNKDIKKGMNMTFDTAELGYFMQWKMMGEYDYAMGLEPCNVPLEDVGYLKEHNLQEFLEPDHVKEHHIKFEFVEK